MSSYIKILILIIFFYFLTLLQTSFLVHFSIFGLVPNFVLLLVILWNFSEKTKNLTGLFAALIGGFYLDVFSNRFFGFNILILLGIVIFIKLILKRYVRFSLIREI